MAFSPGDKVQTRLGTGKVVDDHADQRAKHNGNWPSIYTVELDPVPPAKRGSTFSFHESELQGVADTTPNPEPAP
jgi:hypothetical protein